MTHLHLGCGDVRLPSPWTNVDRRWGPAVDRCDNIGILQHIEPSSVQEIYACHCLDHFDRWTYKTVLARWFKLLKPGGTLRISTPDFEATVEHYQRMCNLQALQGQLYASQDYEGNCRKWAWDEHTARMELESIGFRDVQRYDAKQFFVDINRKPLRPVIRSIPEPAEPKPLQDSSVYTWTLTRQRDDREEVIEIPRSLNITARKP